MPTIALPERPIRRIRRENLKRLIAEAGGTPRQLAAEVQAKFPGENPSDRTFLDKHLSTIASGNRDLGDALAAKLETAMGKPFGWMDQPEAADDPRGLNRGAQARGTLKAG